jgi:hypothetical protein
LRNHAVRIAPLQRARFDRMERCNNFVDEAGDNAAT